MSMIANQGDFFKNSFTYDEIYVFHKHDIHDHHKTTYKSQWPSKNNFFQFVQKKNVS